MKGRSYFYKTGTLVKEGIIHINAKCMFIVQILINLILNFILARFSRGAGDFMSGIVEIDRRMLDFLAGIDSEINEIVEGTNLFHPNVEMSKVILPQEQKDLIIQTVKNFESYEFFLFIILLPFILIKLLLQIH